MSDTKYVNIRTKEKYTRNIKKQIIKNKSSTCKNMKPPFCHIWASYFCCRSLIKETIICRCPSNELLYQDLFELALVALDAKVYGSRLKIHLNVYRLTNINSGAIIPHSWPITWFVLRVTRQASLVEQEF